MFTDRLGDLRNLQLYSADGDTKALVLAYNNILYFKKREIDGSNLFLQAKNLYTILSLDDYSGNLTDLLCAAQIHEGYGPVTASTTITFTDETTATLDIGEYIYRNTERLAEDTTIGNRSDYLILSINSKIYNFTVSDDKTSIVLVFDAIDYCAQPIRQGLMGFGMRKVFNIKNTYENNPTILSLSDGSFKLNLKNFNAVYNDVIISSAVDIIPSSPLDVIHIRFFYSTDSGTTKEYLPEEYDMQVSIVFENNDTNYYCYFKNNAYQTSPYIYGEVY